MKRKFLCLGIGWLLVLLVVSVSAQPAAFGPADPNATYNYLCPPQAVPTIDATNFYINNGSFTVNFASVSASTEFYEPYDVLNYTNNGTMVTDTGFRFDTQPTSGNPPRLMAANFYNAGFVSADSANNVVNGNIFANAGQILVSATNIINSGTLDVGVDDFIQLSGNSADLSFGTLNTEQSGLNPVINSAAIGLNTNAWNPFGDLTAGFAFGSPPDNLFLFPSTSYIKADPQVNGSTIYRAVFVENVNPQTPYNVYIDQFGLLDPNQVGVGAAHIEWDCYYQDPATGNLVTNYVDLTDDYFLGAATNNFLTGSGYPANFTLGRAITPQFSGVTPITAGFQNIFPNLSISNRYAYFNGQLINTSEPTNVSESNPYGVLTNMPGRIQITASNELNLAYTTIFGPNYMSITAPKQFDGSGGADIVVPYSDLNLGPNPGVIPGSLAVSNVLAQFIPLSIGTIDAWTTRFLVAVTNNGVAVTNDYRVLLVLSDLQSESMPAVQNLTLNATNNLVISDVLNVFGSFYANANNLTVTTNGYGNGATSVAGQLNWNNSATFGPTQIPNVLWLTNSGTLSAINNAIFGSSALPYGAFINNTLVQDVGTVIYATNFLNAGVISNGLGGFQLQAQTAVMTNGLVQAGGDLTVTSPSLVLSNENLQVGKMLSLQATNLLTDTGVTNGEIWVVGINGISGVDGGFNLPVKPAVGDLLGTTVTNISPASRRINNVWAGQDRGPSGSGYTNNVAVGHLVLDAQGSTSFFYFTGASTSNAMYVDELELQDYATNLSTSGGAVTCLSFNTNMTIYYAQALINGQSVAARLNGQNGGHLVWVPTYAGYFSSTNMVYPNGTTNTLNLALVQDANADSDGDGVPNSLDSTPVFVSSEVGFTGLVTNRPPLSVQLQWVTIPNATNYIYYRTSLTSSTWLPFTNFNNWYYGNVAVSNTAHVNWFVSPLTSPPFPGVPGYSTNVWVFDAITNAPRYYQVIEQPNLLFQ